jgi:L-ascorbate metabolism protein UlaG (beta-lactamase superfamily)
MTPPPSDHFNGKTFFNPGGGGPGSLPSVIKWKLTSRATPWPKHVEVVRQPLPAVPEGDGTVATWVGHSTFLIRSAAATVVTDPVFSETVGPIPGFGPRRVVAPGISFDELPRVDLVLLSHDHYDHCDVPTLRRLARRDDPLVVAPMGHGTLLSKAGFHRIVELDWWQEHACGPGLSATLVPAKHWTRRTPFDTNRRLWGGFMLRMGGRLVYFAGDSGSKVGMFAEIRTRCGAPDLALIPIGAYEPRWFMAPAHMNPAEAVRVHLEVGARRSIAMHWGTLQLTDEGRLEPVRALGEARAKAGLAPADFEALEIGASASA